MDDLGRRVAAVQRDHFDRADAERFRWTTGAKGFAETEDELLAPFLEQVEPPCLEIGCGEGNNLVRLQERGPCFGVDLFSRKLTFAAHELPQTRLAAARASRLPFRDQAFATVFIRDLLHHLPSPEAALAEAVRVLRAGGLLCLLEPNGRNPLIRLQTLLVPAEADARRFGTELIAGWLATLPLREVRVATAQPLPLRRMLLHYRFGFPVLGRCRGFRRILCLLEAAAARALPRDRWIYVTATARRGMDPADSTEPGAHPG